MTAFELFRSARLILEDAGIDDAEADARLLVEEFCNISREKYLLERTRQVSETEIEAVTSNAKKRAEGVPVQYLIEWWEFCGHRFSVGEGVLIPRPETEELVEYVLEKVKDLKSPVIFDLCSGSGCIGISLKHSRPDASVYLIEKSVDALSYLEKNKISNGFGNSVVSVQYDILKGMPDFLPVPDVIVSNPPYINSAEIETLQKEVLSEPAMALDGGEDGLLFYRCLADDWLSEMNDGGIIAIECGEEQADKIASLFSKHSTETEIKNDFYGTDRFVYALK